MKKDIQIFNYENKQIRTVEKNGQVWFIAKDVANILGYTNERKAIRDHVDDEDKLREQIVTSGQRREVFIINEAGIYSLIFSSKLKTAKQFKHWVTHEVLPEIRQHGMYLTGKAAELYAKNPEAFDDLLNKYVEEKKENVRLQEQILNERPFTLLGYAIMPFSGSITVQEFGQFMRQKGIPIGQNRCYEMFRKENYVCSRKGKQWNKPTQKAIEQGLLNLSIGRDGFHSITMVTPKGCQVFAEKLFKEHYPLLVIIEQGETE
ncbi:MAG: phage antirepressor KilAC domain-containing protein [Synergistaceae bacterium]|nr:phage antirepressor KilAC domain-containing protein [Synergistaceae bacterium]